ncbi:MAG: branched-chain amino acid ABC transporter permease [Burkholderiaceae bacterium]|nr:branched-chain amino acid ABC transporter permease [Burkholderiaceae bacterium]
MLDFLLLANVIATGTLLGVLYAAIGVGFSLSFGLAQVANIAHPTFVVVGAYAAFSSWKLGIDPILGGFLWCPVFFLLGLGIYRTYHAIFERRDAPSLNGMTFFFGMMFVIEVGLLLEYGVEYKIVSVPFSQGVVVVGGLDLPRRLLYPCIAGLAMVGALAMFVRYTFTGRAMSAVALDLAAVRLMGANPVRIKSIACGLAFATAAVAGALLLVAWPVNPSSGRELIGRMFAVSVLGGVTSVRGALAAGVLLGIAESLVQIYAGASWATAVGFVVLLGTLAVRPQGMFRR